MQVERRNKFDVVAVGRVKNVFVDRKIVPKEGQLEDENYINWLPEVEGRGPINLVLDVFEKSVHFRKSQPGTRKRGKNETNQTRPVNDMGRLVLFE